MASPTSLCILKCISLVYLMLLFSLFSTFTKQRPNTAATKQSTLGNTVSTIFASLILTLKPLLLMLAARLMKSTLAHMHIYTLMANTELKKKAVVSKQLSYFPNNFFCIMLNVTLCRWGIIKYIIYLFIKPHSN